MVLIVILMEVNKSVTAIITIMVAILVMSTIATIKNVAALHQNSNGHNANGLRGQDANGLPGQNGGIGTAGGAGGVATDGGSNCIGSC